MDVAGMPTPRPRFNGKFAYMPKTYVEYQKALVTLLQAKGITKSDYCRIHLIFHFQYPKSTPKYKRIDGAPLFNKFDTDNLAKGVMDALQKAEIIEDDRQIYDLRVEKYRTTESNKIYVKLWER